MSKKTENIELIETLICKKITQQPNGTYTLESLYPKDISLVSFPHQLSLSLWLNFYTTRTKPLELEIKISSDSALKEDIIVPVTINQDDSIKGAASTPVIIRNILINALSEDEVEISYRQSKKKWKIARVFNLLKHQQSIH